MTCAHYFEGEMYVCVCGGGGGGGVGGGTTSKAARSWSNDFWMSIICGFVPKPAICFWYICVSSMVSSLPVKQHGMDQ